VSVPPVVESGELVYKETVLQKLDVVEKLKRNGVELTSDSTGSYFELNGVKPLIYTLPEKVKMYIYLYGNAKEIRKAREDFAIDPS
jgi:hypothetical protein